MPDAFEAREVVITHEWIWNSFEDWASQRNLVLLQIPNGTDDEGQPVMDDPDQLPCYCFMPRT